MDNASDAPGRFCGDALFVERPMTDGVKMRLAELRAQMAKQRLDGMVIGREDMFQGEEVPPGD